MSFVNNNKQLMLNVNLSVELQERLDILQEMKPAHIDDIFPLIKADAALLRSFLSKLQNHNGIGADHPIYYFSEKLKVSCNIVQLWFNRYFQVKPLVL